MNKSERERQIPYNVSYKWNLKKKKLKDTENRLVVDRGGVRGKEKIFY